MSSTVHTSAAALLAAMLAAAAAAPEQPDSPADGPCRPGVVWFRYMATGARCAVKLINTRPRLLEFADRIRKQWALYGGGPKPAETAAPRARRATTWPAVLLKVWKEQIECGAWDDVVNLATGRLGGIFGYSTEAAPLMWVAPLEVEGLPARFVSCRRDDGRWLVMDRHCCLMVTARTHGTRAAAEAEALQRWGQQSPEARARILQQAEAAPQVDQAQALADYCRARGIGAEAAAPADATTETAPTAKAAPAACQAATAAPRALPDRLQAWQAAAAGCGATPAATLAQAEALATACLARYGSTDPAACVHLASFAAWHAATLADLPAADAPAAPKPTPTPAPAPAPALHAPHARMAEALAILAAAVGQEGPQQRPPASPLALSPVGPSESPQRPPAAAHAGRQPADAMAARLAQLVAQHVGTDPARLAPALRREAARVIDQAHRVTARLASIWHDACAQLQRMAAELEAPPADLAHAGAADRGQALAGAPMPAGAPVPAAPRRWLRPVPAAAGHAAQRRPPAAGRPPRPARAGAWPAPGHRHRGPPGRPLHPPAARCGFYTGTPTTVRGFCTFTRPPP